MKAGIFEDLGLGHVVRIQARRSWVLDAVLALGLLGLLAGCAYPANYQEWQWKQWNPNYVPLPGAMDR